MKIHVVLSKEDIDTSKIDSSKIAVVFDVLLATTTISALLHYGAKEVIPVMDGTEALEVMKGLDSEISIVTGEMNGKTIEGFEDPLPRRLKPLVLGKTVVLSTTNGTVAIGKVSGAKKVYAASLPSADAVARKVVTEHADDTIIVVCAGSSRRFAMEDFYGAGYFIHKLVDEKNTWELTDSAKSALYFYRGNSDKAAEILKESKVGEMMLQMDLEEDILLAAEKGIFPVVPQLEGGKMIVKEGISWGMKN